jgi:hypothetical protein
MRTIEQIEESGRWVCAKNSEFKPSAVTRWREIGLISPRYYKKIKVVLTRNNGWPQTLRIFFYVREALDRAAKAIPSHSDWMKGYWRGREKVNGALRQKAAAEFLGVTTTTLKRMPGLNTEVHELPGRTAKARHWPIADLRKTNRTRREAQIGKDHLSLEQVHHQTGLSRKILRLSGPREGLGLVAVKILCNVVVHGRNGKKWFVVRPQLAFTKPSVRGYMRDHPNLAGLDAPQAAARLHLNRRTVLSLIKAGFLTATQDRVHHGWRIEEKSVGKFERTLRSVNWDLRKAKEISEEPLPSTMPSAASNSSAAAQLESVLHPSRVYDVTDHVRGLNREDMREVLRQHTGEREPRVPPDECTLTITEAWKFTGVNRGTISKAVDAGHINSNGKKGRERLLNHKSVIEWNDSRDNRPETDASVNRKVQKHVH